MTTWASHDLFRDALVDGGYTVQEVEFSATGRALIAETPYALVFCFAADWEDLEHIVDQAQAELTNLAAEHPSPRSWDLYVVAVLRQPDSRFDSLRETLESDIRYARKIVVPLEPQKPEDVERVLRPLLPLKPSAELELIDPLEAVRGELLKLNISVELADTALHAFAHDAEVRVP